MEHLLRTTAAALLAIPVAGFTHGWDTVGKMLAMNPHDSNDGRWDRSPFALKHWEWVANNYAIVVLGRFPAYEGKAYDCTCPNESSRTEVARVLKKINPKIKLLWCVVFLRALISPMLRAHSDATLLPDRYQNAVGDMTVACQNVKLENTPEWWVYDDAGVPVFFAGNASTCGTPAGCSPYLNYSVPEAGDWWMTRPASEVCGPNAEADAALLIDGMMMDGAEFRSPLFDDPLRNLSRYQAVFDGQMRTMEKAQAMYQGINGGEAWGNPLVVQSNSMHWGPPRPTDAPAKSYNYTLQHYGGAFDESFGSFNGLDDEWAQCVGKSIKPNVTCTGFWDVEYMTRSFYAVRNASGIDKKTVCLHLVPGPANSPVGSTCGPHSCIGTPSWYGPEQAPWQYMNESTGYTPLQVVNAMKKATGERLEEILAAFLIVASETTFFGYGWFYGIEGGYVPCDDGGGDNRTLCLAPDGFYPEFKEPLGPPKGLAVQDGTEWRREFAHASVFVDVANTTRNTITWRGNATSAV